MKNMLLLAAGMAAGCGLAPGVDWPNYLGPGWLGKTSESPGTGRPEKIWEKDVGMGCGSFAAKGGVVLTMGNDGRNTSHVWCLDARDGKEIWKFAFASDSTRNNQGGGNTPYYGGPNSTPAIDGGNVYVIGRFGQVFCLDLRTGESKWAFDWAKELPGFTLPTWSYAASPYIHGDHLFIEPGGKGQATVCLDKATGKVVWKAGDDAASYAMPRIAELGGRPVLLSFNAFGVVGKDPSDGAERFRQRWRTSYDINSAALMPVGKDRLFVSSGYGTGCAMYRVGDDGLEQLWKNKNMKNKHTVSVLHEGAIYGFDEDDLVCLDPESGERHWKQGGFGKGALIIADGTLVILGENGKFALAKASQDGFEPSFEERLFEKFHCWTNPVLANGRIFTKDVKGNVIAMAVK